MASSATPPAEIARDVLLSLSKRRLQPTPDNFSAIYHELAGTPDASAQTRDILHHIIARLPNNTAARARIVTQIQQALEDNKHTKIEPLYTQWLKTFSAAHAQTWNTLIERLIIQWDTHQVGWTTARKRESLDRVLATQNADALYERLQALVQAWNKAPVDDSVEESGDSEGKRSDSAAKKEQAPARSHSAPASAASTADESDAIIATLRELLLAVLETIAPPLLEAYPDLLKEIGDIAGKVRNAQQAERLKPLQDRIRQLAYRIEMAVGDTGEIRAGVLNLLNLLLENIATIVVDDQWLHGQIDMLRKILSRLDNVRVIDAAEQRLKEVIYKQSQLKQNLTESQNSLRELLANFVVQIARMGDSTGHYHSKISSAAKQIAEARDISEISEILDQVMDDTAVIQREALQVHEELKTAQERAEQAEQRIAELQQELDQTSHLVRHDQLTGCQNRRGLQETFEREVSRAARRKSTLCLGLLDIDNFKQLNDTHGHDVGDQALVHLTSVVLKNLRPSDSLARMGGEEFVILYPETELSAAAECLVRLQRELTRAYFLANDQKLLITFSAGVTEWVPGEELESGLKRADEAMYQAKQSGKNKVVASRPPQSPT